jgi:hypothetical protein
MAASLCVPVSISDKTREGLSKKFLSIQAAQGAALKVVSIYFDSEAKEHVLWYYPNSNQLLLGM